MVFICRYVDILRWLGERKAESWGWVGCVWVEGCWRRIVLGFFYILLDKVRFGLGVGYVGFYTFSLGFWVVF